MKKTYNSPMMKVVQIAHILPIAASEHIDRNGAKFIEQDAQGAAMTKQNNPSVWDDWSN